MDDQEIHLLASRIAESVLEEAVHQAISITLAGVSANFALLPQRERSRILKTIQKRKASIR
jgi:hypothetical protein